MYGAYYPYLCGRGPARSFHHAPHFQYDRFNVQAGGHAADSYGGALSSGSASSGAQSPGSPHATQAPLAPHAHLAHAPARLRTKREDGSGHGRSSVASSDSEGECGGGGGGDTAGRAQYVSANCVVFTHYAGDVAAVVDEHFARALSLDKSKESVPMVSRNLPPSFFNASAVSGVCVGGVGVGGVGVGGMGVGSVGVGMELYEYDPWHGHYGGYGSAAAAAAQYHAAAHAHHASYSGLLLGRGSLHHQYSHAHAAHPHSAHAHSAHAAHAHAPHSAHAAHLDASACSPYAYSAVPGLEAQVQDSSKEVYWF